MTEILDLSSDDFESQVLKSDVPVLVDFWATWCGPCRQLAPTVKAIAEAYQGRLKVAKVDADSNQELITQYKVAHLPTLLLFKNGVVREQLVGNQPRPRLEERIESLLAS